jgi:hypothetical protein
MKAGSELFTSKLNKPHCGKSVEPFNIALLFQTQFDPFKHSPEVTYPIFCPHLISPRYKSRSGLTTPYH